MVTIQLTAVALSPPRVVRATRGSPVVPQAATPPREPDNPQVIPQAETPACEPDNSPVIPEAETPACEPRSRLSGTCRK
jgi:hypothetical protein